MVIRDTTMLDLVHEVSRETRDDVETVNRVVVLVNSGRVRLTGSFRDTRFDQGTEISGRVRSARIVR